MAASEAAESGDPIRMTSGKLELKCPEFGPVAVEHR
jgi:hypothetical protein